MNDFKHILCVIDNTQASEQLLTRAVSIAKRNQSMLSVIYIIESQKIGFSLVEKILHTDIKTLLRQEATQRLQRIVTPFISEQKIETKVLFGKPFYEIIYYVLQHQCDLVMKIPENPTWTERLFGSNDMHLLRKCPSPVWFIKEDHLKPFGNIMAAIDIDIYPESDEESQTRETLNDEILGLSTSLAQHESGHLHIVHAWDVPEETLMHSAFVKMSKSDLSVYISKVERLHAQKIDAFIAQRKETFFKHLQLSVHLIRGLPGTAIATFAHNEHIDLVVMGTVGRTGLSGLLMGNTAEDILNQIDCSVLAVKPAGFKTPISL